MEGEIGADEALGVMSSSLRKKKRTKKMMMMREKAREKEEGKEVPEVTNNSRLLQCLLAVASELTADKMHRLTHIAKSTLKLTLASLRPHRSTLIEALVAC